MAIDPVLLKQLQDYADQQYNTRMAAAVNPLASGQRGDNLQLAQLAKSRLEEITNYGNQYNWGGDKANVLQNYISSAPGGDVYTQAYNELIGNQKQLDAQTQQLQQAQQQYQQQMFGGTGQGQINLNSALSDQSGALGQLNTFLGNQESQTFNQQLQPLINMAMGAQGLQNSGANIELQSKALGQLQQAREQNTMQAALGSMGQLQGMQRSDLLGNIGFQQQMGQQTFDLQRAAVTMQYQAKLEQQREQLARDLAQRQGGGSLMGQILGGVGAAASIGFAPFTGGASLAGLGPSLGLLGSSMGSQNGGSMGMMAGQAGSGIGSSFFANNKTQTVPYAGPMNSQGSPWQMTPGYQIY